MAGRVGFCLRAQDSGLLSLPWGQSSSSQQISPEILLRARESSHNSLDSSVRSQASSYLLSKHSVPGIDCDEDSGHADAPQVTLSSWLKTCLGSIWWRFPGLTGARGWRLTSCCESSGRSLNQMGMVMVVVTPVLPTHRVLRMLKQENGWESPVSAWKLDGDVSYCAWCWHPTKGWMVLPLPSQVCAIQN